MEYDWQFSQKIKCDDEEKRECMQLIADLINLSIMARRNGLLALIKVAEESSSFLLNKGLQLVVDGVTPQIVRNVLESYILAGDFEGKALLERCIILEGVAAIQQGLHPKVTKEFLLSFLGEDSYDFYQKEFEGGNKDTLESYLKKIEATSATSKIGTKLDQIILKLDDDAIEKFLMEINTGDLAKSMKCMGGPAQLKIFNSLPKKSADALRDTVEDLVSLNESDMANAQELALDIITDLQARSTNTGWE
jgi:FliG C-terminal domain